VLRALRQLPARQDAPCPHSQPLPSRNPSFGPTFTLPVHFKITKIKGSDDFIQQLHMLLFKRKGTVRRGGALGQAAGSV
jgi:hypothetical protein